MEKTEQVIEGLDQAAYLIRDLRDENKALKAALVEAGKKITKLQKGNALISALKFTQRKLNSLTSKQFERGGDKPIRDRIEQVLAEVTP